MHTNTLILCLVGLVVVAALLLEVDLSAAKEAVREDGLRAQCIATGGLWLHTQVDCSHGQNVMIIGSDLTIQGSAR